MIVTSEINERYVSPIARIFYKAAALDRAGMVLLRIGLVLVLIWIGGLKFAPYEAVSIVRS
jgi:reactive chlorine resistance protein C